MNAFHAAGARTWRTRRLLRLKRLLRRLCPHRGPLAWLRVRRLARLLQRRSDRSLWLHA